MELALWTYEGPPHVGAMRIATSMRDVHYVIHAPQGDTYADLLFTMIERSQRRPPVSYTTFQARDLGADTAGLLKTSVQDAYDTFKPAAMMVGESCTAELIQDQPGSLAQGMNLPVPVVPLELPAYSKKENWGASESFYYLVRHILASASPEDIAARPEPGDTATRRPLANVLGPTSLGFRCRDDDLTGIDASQALDAELSRLPWYSRSVDSTYLTGKRVFIFGDGSHVVAAARIAREELAFEVVGIGTFSREMARDVRAAAKTLELEALITDDYLDVEEAIANAQPELVLGTQMERHIAKRLGIPCAVISAPVHVQDFPARYSPQVGFEGANVIFDTWVHPLTMGLEEHLLHMFRDDFEFNDQAAPSHLHSGEGAAAAPPHVTGSVSELLSDTVATENGSASWTADAEQELKKIPFFVRGKARRNTEAYARDAGHPSITIETLYEAKAHYAR